MCLVGKDNSKNYQKQNINYKLNMLECIPNLVAFVSKNCKKRGQSYHNNVTKTAI